MRTAKKETIEDVKVKMMVWGGPGAGKSRFALTSPKPLVIDLEKSTALYVSQFDFFRCECNSAEKNIKNPVTLTKTIIEEITAGEYNGEVETLIIDPVTDLIDNLESILLKKYEDKIGKSIDSLNQLQKSKWYAYRRDNTRLFLDMILSLPLNVIFLAREKNMWDKKDGTMQPTGKTFDGLDIIEYLPDVVIHLRKDEEATIKKSRIGNIPEKLEINKWEDITNFLSKNEEIKKLTAVKNIKRETA